MTTSWRGHMVSFGCAGIRGAAAAHDARRHAAACVANARYSVACSSAFSRVGTSHQITTLPVERGDLLGRGAALAGALPAGDQDALSDAWVGGRGRARASTSLRMRRVIAALRRRISAASSAVGALKSSGAIYASPSAANAAARRSAISPAGERIDVLAADPGPRRKRRLVVELREAGWRLPGRSRASAAPGAAVGRTASRSRRAPAGRRRRPGCRRRRLQPRRGSGVRSATRLQRRDQGRLIDVRAMLAHVGAGGLQQMLADVRLPGEAEPATHRAAPRPLRPPRMLQRCSRTSPCPARAAGRALRRCPPRPASCRIDAAQDRAVHGRSLGARYKSAAPRRTRPDRPGRGLPPSTA